MERLRSECPLCGGVELPTGHLELREDGKEYAEFSCHSCGSTGWEWAVGRDQMELMRGHVGWIATLCHAATFVLVCWSLALGFSELVNGRPIGPALGVFLTALLPFLLVVRPRIVRRHPVSGEITLSWGVHFPVVYRRFQTNAWETFVIEEKKKLTPRYSLRGITRQGGSILLFRSSSRENVEEWREVMMEVIL